MSSPALPGIFGAMAPLLDHYGYFAVGLLVTLEDFGIPVPGETVLIAAALYAGAGRMNVVAVGIVAVLAAMAGDNIGFLIGHYGGRALALRFGRYVFLTAERLDRAEAFFQRHGGKIIVVARFIEGLRQANGIVAGITGMPWRRFAVFNAIGAALWVGVWVSLGYLAGNNIVTIYDQLTRYSLYVLIALVVVVLALVGLHLRRRARRRARRREAADAPEAAAPAVAGTAGADPAAEADARAEGTAQNGSAENGRGPGPPDRPGRPRHEEHLADTGRQSRDRPPDGTDQP